MLKKCANPLCPNAFRVLSQGKLFQMEVDDFVACANRKNRSPRRVERYWLCDRCCSTSNGEKTLITPKGDAKIAYGGGQFNKDGKGIYVTTDKDSEFIRLAYVDPASKQHNYLSSHISLL